MPSAVAQAEFAAYTNAHKPSSTRSSSESSVPGYASSRSSSSRSASTSPTMPAAAPVYQIPATHFENNTGPKGVIADAQSYERARKRSFRQTLYGLSNSLASNVAGVGERLAAPGRRRGSGKSTESSEDDDDFMRSWREKRLNELQEQGSQVRTRRLSPSKRRWGTVATVDPAGYLDAIDRVPQGVVVVVLIYDEDSTVSGIVEDAVADLARRHEFVRFVKLNHRDAEMTPAAVPALLAYKSGELFANLVSVIDEIPANRSLSTSSLEDVLKRHYVL